MSTYRPQITRVETGGSSVSKVKAGKELLEQKRFDEALVQFEAAVQADPNDRKAHLSCATTLMKLRRFDEVIAHCEEVHRIDPMNVQAYLRYARALLSKQEVDAALEKVETALRINSQSGIGYMFAGYIYGLKQDFEKARNSFSKALLLNPRMVRARLGLAKVLLAEGRIEEALTQIASASRIDPKNGVVQEGLGRAYLAKGDAAEAMTAFGKAIDLGREQSGEAHLGYAQAAIQLSRFEEAEEHLRKADENAKSRIRITRTWGDLDYGRGEFMPAVEQYRAALILAEEGSDLERQLQASTPDPSDSAAWKALADDLRQKLDGLEGREDLAASVPEADD